MDIGAGYFAKLQLASDAEITISFAKELAYVAHNFSKNRRHSALNRKANNHQFSWQVPYGTDHRITSDGHMHDLIGVNNTNNVSPRLLFTFHYFLLAVYERKLG